MSSDTLTVTSRAFYERSKAKVAISIIVGASSLMLLGFCSVAGGRSEAAGKYIDALPNYNDDNVKNAFQSLEAGYGEN